MLEFQVMTEQGETYVVTARDFVDALVAGALEIKAQGDDDRVESVDLAPGECASKLWPIWRGA